jgi:hypothetical protein
MNRAIRGRGAMTAVVVVCAVAGCSPRDASYQADVRPILEANCLECHRPGGAGYAASGFDMSSYEALMKGGKFGPFVIPGDVFSSNLIVLVEGRADPSIAMPHGRAKLDPADIEILKVWIQEGAKNN